MSIVSEGYGDCIVCEQYYIVHTYLVCPVCRRGVLCAKCFAKGPREAEHFSQLLREHYILSHSSVDLV